MNSSAPSAARPGRLIRRRLAAAVVTTPLVLVLAAPAVAADGAGPDPTTAQLATPAQVVTPMSAGALAGAQVSVGGDPDAYRFIATINGTPVHWDRCKTIGYRVSLRRAPAGAVRQTREAVRRVASASGLRFTYQGHSTVRPYLNKQYQRGTRLVIGWMKPTESKYLSGGAAGVGGPQWYGSGEIVKGFVQLNSTLNNKLADGFGTGPRYGYQGTKGQLLMHEIGHVVGIDHVRDKPQVMYPTMTHKLAVFGAGDRNGLERVGKLRRCF